jgi:hypothetical protein
MPGLVPGIHVFASDWKMPPPRRWRWGVDAAGQGLCGWTASDQGGRRRGLHQLRPRFRQRPWRHQGARAVTPGDALSGFRFCHSKVRSLPPQPVLRSAILCNPRKGPEIPAFRAFDLVSTLPISRPGSEIAESLRPVRGNSRFGEIIGGDRFDHDCPPAQFV